MPELAVGEAIASYPSGFHIHPKVKKLLEQRLEMAPENAPRFWNGGSAGFRHASAEGFRCD